MDFPQLGNSDHVVISVSIEFPLNSKRDVPFHLIVYDYLVLIRMVFVIIWEMFLGKISLNSILPLLLVKFFEWIQVGIDVYIPHCQYHVKPYSSPWFSAAFAAAIVDKNHFSQLYEQNKPTESKVKFRQASNHCKRVLEASKFAYANKTKESITSQKLGSWDIWQISNSVLKKGKYAIPSLINGQELLPSESDKAKLFAENYFKISNPDDSCYSLSAFISRTNPKRHNIFATPKMVKKVITNRDLWKASGSDCIPVLVLKNCEPNLPFILAKLFNKCLKDSFFLDC